MNIPSISLDHIPGLEGAMALFGATAPGTGANDDRIVEIMVYIYEVIPPDMFF